MKMNNVDKNLGLLRRSYANSSSVIIRAVEAMHYMDRLNRVYTDLINSKGINIFADASKIPLDQQFMLKVMIDNKFDYVKTLKSPIVENELNGSDIIKSCKYLISALKAISMTKPVKEIKKAKTLIPITFNFGVSDRCNKDSIESNRFNPVGKIVTFEYYCELANLWVFDFDGHQFPLYENEFVWL